MATSANRVTLPLSTYRPKRFLLSVDGPLATLTLNRPAKKNPLTFESYRELIDFFQACKQDSSVRAVIVTGAGGNFSSGGDVFEIIAPLIKMGAKDLAAFTRMTGALVRAIRDCEQLVVAAVDGVCAGAGAIIAMASDLRLGSTRAKVAFLFNKVGLAGCDMGACAILPRIVGFGRASELLMTGRFMSAQEGERWGFFNRLAEPEQLLGEARAMAMEIAAGPGFANALTKRMLNLEWSMSLDDAIEAESIAQALCMTTQDFKRAFEAFAAKRAPVFEGN